jgi:multiple sugar transport system substrate-binding protein
MPGKVESRELRTSGSGLSRRRFLETTVGATAGLTWLALGRPPAVHAATRTLTMLTPVNYVPPSDVKLKELADAFGKQANVEIRIDSLQSVKMPAKLAAEAQTQGGHDLVIMDTHLPWFHANNLVDMSDICDDLAKRHGEWYGFAHDAAFVRDHWAAVPYFYISFPGSYRKSLFEQVEEPPPDTYEALLKAGRKLKKIGHPVGIPISQTTDAYSSMQSILWSYGGKEVEADGTTPAIRSEATAASIEFVKALYNDAMTSEVLSWDNAGNNRFMISGRGSWIHNPASHYIVAKNRHMPVADDIYFTLCPAGPGGRHTVTIPRSMGIWKWAQDVELCKDFVRFLYEDKHYVDFIVAGDNYNHPIFQDMEDHEVWDIDPKYKPMKTIGRYSHLYGWPAPPSEKILVLTYSYTLPNMYAKAVTGTPTDEAMQWAEDRIVEIFRS